VVDVHRPVIVWIYEGSDSGAAAPPMTDGVALPG
jgi:hypothetical protein